MTGQELYRLWCVRLAAQRDRGESVPERIEWSFLSFGERAAWSDVAGRLSRPSE